MQLNTVTIPAGSGAIDVSIKIVDDSIRDGLQSVSFGATATNFSSSNVSLTVLDYEPLLWVEPGFVLAEADTPQSQIIMIRIPAPAPDTGVTLNLTADLEGQLQFPSQVAIAPGQTTAEVMVSAVNDTFAESLKTVRISASGP